MGLSPRESKGKPVKNKGKDIALVCNLLSANGIGPLGKHASGMDVTLRGSVFAVTVEGKIGALTAGIGSKIPLGFVDKIARLAKGQTIPNTLKAKMWADVMNKVSNEALKAGYHEVYTRVTGKESEKQLSEVAAKAMLKEKKLQCLSD